MLLFRSNPIQSESDDSDTSSTLTHPSDESDSSSSSENPGSSTSSNDVFRCFIRGCTATVPLEFEDVKRHFRHSLNHYGGSEASSNKRHPCPIGRCGWAKKGTVSDRNRLAEHLCSSEHYNVGMRCPICNVKQKSGRLSSSRRHREGEAGNPGACRVCKGCRMVFANGRERTEHEAICLHP